MPMRRAPLSMLALLAALLPASVAQAQLTGPGLAPPPAPAFNTAPQPAAIVAVPQQPIDDRVAFNSSERWIIPTFYQRVRDKQQRAARSKRYERTLPAGLNAPPAKGDLLPMTLLASLDRLPGPLLRDLPPARPGTDRVMVGKDILMVNTATGEVLDVLDNVLF